MFMSSGAGSIPPIGVSKLYYMNTETEREKNVQPAAGGNYDSVSVSATASDKSKNFMDMVSRLSQEVRTATTTGNIRALHDQVSSGNYLPDATAIASRILFLGGDA